MSRRLPSLNWLRVFEAAARTGSFARAAERLAMSPPAVSQQVRALEDHLGRPLFERAAAGVTLTEAGRGLLVVVSDALGRMESATAALAMPGGPPLVLGVSLMLSAGWLMPRLPRFQEAHPDVTLDLHTLVGREVPPGHAALWIAFGPPRPGAETAPLFGEDLVPVARPDLVARIRTRADLLRERLIEVSDHRKTWAQVFDGEVLPPEARVTHVDTSLTAYALAGAGGGVALARPPASDGLVALHGLAPCLPGLRVPGVERYHLAWPAGARLGRDARRFRDWLLAEVGDDI